MKTADGAMIALDGKVSLDESAVFRHPEHERSPTPRRRPAGGCGEGQGSELRQARRLGGHHREWRRPGDEHTRRRCVRGAEFPGSPKPANFLDIGGGASAEVMANGLEIIIGDDQVKSVFVNVFGGITACDAVANGIVQAFELLASRDEHVDVPLVVRLDGNNAELGRRILTDAELPGLEQVHTMDGARRAAQLAAS